MVASDLVPELLDRGRAGPRPGPPIDDAVSWEPANAEALPYDAGTFDTVLSCIGVMFAPHHQRAADELVRVCRPGGTIGLLSWTPEGFIGQMFATMKLFVPAPPAGASPPPLWGDTDHVRSLLGDRVTDVQASRGELAVDRFADGAAFRDYFKASYGPTINAYRGIAGDPDKVAELDAALAGLGDRALAGGNSMDWEYLVVTARRV